ncbi:MAG: response regulator [Planctomycetes bacterium]|nr:response regulator [Planctomycetota bacterium]MCP4771898.1 response regulator [Planctomycetota bacterium]MCP4861940.1 response regulator [Planctomycetota bacterium]
MEQQTIDLHISDVIMPGMNGYDLVDLVGQSYPNTRVLLVSGFAGRADGNAKSAHTAALLAKPYSATTLLHRVHSHLFG